MAHRVLDIHVLPLILQLLETGEKLVQIFIGNGMVVALSDIGGGLENLGGLGCLRGLGIRGDGLAVGTV